jgi:hypothetical protein
LIELKSTKVAKVTKVAKETLFDFVVVQAMIKVRAKALKRIYDSAVLGNTVLSFFMPL